ncbi:Uma2 family endonuclease [Anabaena cylindrica UHCC 0172]|uniref:Uma2 family endonuclease n=1 Tax=Anabaena cylindrica TaxID=1165 RepID=UPI002B218BF7|nr:Uma2 family endonuclease [Anabaena cylindrica]MEA5551877.1 Uma2 family endonuclease [Anabaena cylindrica UHCC 0172]
MITTGTPQTVTLPDHTQLPESNGEFVFAERTVGQNFQEHPQSILLTDSIQSILEKRHPDGNYCIGQDSGIYWRLTDPLEKGAEAPDWFYVPNVPPHLKGKPRRSYVLWQEIMPPLIVLEFVSGDGSEERDKTPWKGKFWVYEQVIRPAFYGIYEVEKSSIELYHLIEDHYELLPANERGHFPIHSLGVELGIWQGKYQNLELPWLRWWDDQGNLLFTGHENVELEKQKREQTELLLSQERQRTEALTQKLRELGINLDE